MSRKINVKDLCGLFRVLSDETRLRLLLALQGGEQNVTGLCRKLRLAQPTVSHHLSLLRIHGLVKNRREGKLVYYCLDGSKYARAAKAVKFLLK